MIDTQLIKRLKAIVGKQYVLNKESDLITFEYDGSVDRSQPTVVVLPSSTGEVSQLMKLASEYGIPIVARGAATGLSGGAIAEQGGILLTLTRMNRIIEIDPKNQFAVVEPGVVNLELTQAVSKFDLYYAPDPSSQQACTIGGNIAENSGGPHCLAYGVTTNHVLGMEVVTADGEISWYGNRTRECPGYDLRGIMIGSEGTLSIVTKAILRLIRKPESVKTLLAIYKDLDQASATVAEVISSGIVPAAMEMMDDLAIKAVEPAVHAGYPENAGAVLLVEVEGLSESVEEEAFEIEKVMDKYEPQIFRDLRTRISTFTSAGWSFSSFGGPERIREKFEAFAHEEYNKGKYKDEAHLKKCIETGSDLFDRNVKKKKVDKNFFPKDLLKLMEENSTFYFS